MGRDRCESLFAILLGNSCVVEILTLGQGIRVTQVCCVLKWGCVLHHGGHMFISIGFAMGSPDRVRVEGPKHMKF